jgi:tetratricopeptide (TPR) repeat protein
MQAARLQRTNAGERARYEEARILFTKAGDHNGMAQALLKIARIHYLDSNLVATQKVAEEALATYRANGNEEGISKAVGMVGIALAEQGDLHPAREDFAAALVACRKIGSRLCEAISLSNLAELLVQEGDLKTARGMSQEALGIFRELPHPSGVVMALSDLATISYEEGDLAAAEKLIEQTRKAAREMNAEANVSHMLSLVGKIGLMQGNFTEARRNLEQARAIEKQGGDRWNEASMALDIAQLAIEEGKFLEAEQLTRQTAEEFRKMNAAHLRTYALALLAQSLAAQNKLREAQGVLAEVLRFAKDVKGLYVRLPVTIAAAQTRASASQFSDPAEVEQATLMLKGALAEASSHGYLHQQYGARLALGEIEMKSGKVVNGRRRLSALEREARRKGFVLIARKSAHAGES